MKRHPSIIYIAEHQAIAKNAPSLSFASSAIPNRRREFPGRVLREVTYRRISEIPVNSISIILIPRYHQVLLLKGILTTRL